MLVEYYKDEVAVYTAAPEEAKKFYQSGRVTLMWKFKI
jgi:hypothetical protein